jgi:hypothetical protein
MDNQIHWLINIKNTTNEKSNFNYWADRICSNCNGVMHCTKKRLQNYTILYWLRKPLIVVDNLEQNFKVIFFKVTFFYFQMTMSIPAKTNPAPNKSFGVIGSFRNKKDSNTVNNKLPLSITLTSDAFPNWSAR